MKKILYFVFCIFIFFSIEAHAEEVKYGNLITDETTIEEDFKLLNMDISNYYKPTKYNYQKWYVIGMAEGYVDTENYDIQTYFYLYNPCEYGGTNNYLSTVASLYINYKIGEHGEENTEVSVSKLDYNKEHLIYKVKGFTYSFTERAEIYITKIKHFNFYGSGITSDSSFKAVANHSKLNGLQVELAFNSTLIIDEVACVSLDVEAEDNFSNWFFGNVSFKEYFLDKVVDKKLRLYFYNFNFPESVKPDSIEYAKFSYYREKWIKEEKRVNTGWSWKWEFVKDEKESSSDKIYSEYIPGSHKFQVGEASEELEFQTFVLGNRIEKEEHGYLSFSEEQKKAFNYDCSILLDNDYTIVRQWTNPASHEGRPDKQFTTYTKLKDIEFIELWYKKDGVLYKCQTVSEAPGDDFIGDVGSEESLWDKFVKWVKDNFPFSALLLLGLPLALIVAAIFFPHVFSLIIICIVNAIGWVISILQWILKAIIKIITLPFRLIIRIFKRE